MVENQIKIIFEDEWLVAIDKPAGMVVNNARTVRGETIQNWFTGKYQLPAGNDKDSEFVQKGGVVHRLDKETSGIMLLTKNEVAYNAMKTLFIERKVHKLYSGLVHGEMKAGEGVISQPVIRHPKIWGKFTIGNDLSLTAVTSWEINQVYKHSQTREKYSLLDLKPLTGRTHQLRVHLKHAGHPVVGDAIYLNKKQLQADMIWCPRMWLHALRLEFKHPVTGASLMLESPLPSELQQAAEKLVH